MPAARPLRFTNLVHSAPTRAEMSQNSQRDEWAFNIWKPNEAPYEYACWLAYALPIHRRHWQYPNMRILRKKFKIPCSGIIYMADVMNEQYRLYPSIEELGYFITRISLSRSHIDRRWEQARLVKEYEQRYFVPYRL